MSDIRKVSIGPDYKSGAMHYIVGQQVLGGKYAIHLIKYVKSTSSIIIYIEKEQEIFMWKEFSSSVPVSIEYNINF